MVFCETAEKEATLASQQHAPTSKPVLAVWSMSQAFRPRGRLILLKERRGSMTACASADSRYGEFACLDEIHANWKCHIVCSVWSLKKKQWCGRILRKAQTLTQAMWSFADPVESCKYYHWKKFKHHETETWSNNKTSPTSKSAVSKLDKTVP